MSDVLAQEGNINNRLAYDSLNGKVRTTISGITTYASGRCGLEQDVNPAILPCLIFDWMQKAWRGIYVVGLVVTISEIAETHFPKVVSFGIDSCILS